MKAYLYTFLLLFIGSQAFSQNTDQAFPENYLGSYKGTLLIDSPSGQQKIVMEFQLKKTDTIDRFKYVLVYNNTPRNYSLVVKDRAKGIYEVDENNGIILPAKVLNNTLYSFFEVQGNFLSTRMEFFKDSMLFEILFSPTKNKTITGGSSNEIPEVFGFPISVVQKAILIKQ